MFPAASCRSILGAAVLLAWPASFWRVAAALFPATSCRSILGAAILLVWLAWVLAAALSPVTSGHPGLGVPCSSVLLVFLLLALVGKVVAFGASLVEACGLFVRAGGLWRFPLFRLGFLGSRPELPRSSRASPRVSGLFVLFWFAACGRPMRPHGERHCACTGGCAAYSLAEGLSNIYIYIY